MQIKSLDGGFSSECRAIWKEAFGDGDEFLDYFEKTAFSPLRARALFVENEIASVLYWFEIEIGGVMGTYIYAVATAKKFRGRGYCKALMLDTYRHLESLGYSFALLVPASESLFEFYKGLGYSTSCFIKEYEIVASSEKETVEKIGAKEYFEMRKAHLPMDSVNLLSVAKEFLAGQTEFYKGKGILFCGNKDGERFFCCELLGDESKMPSALAYLGSTVGYVRASGGDKPFAMSLCFSADIPKKFYHAFAFD